MSYTVTSVTPDYQNEVVVVVAHYSDGNDVTYQVKSLADLAEKLLRHDRFLSDVTDLLVLAQDATLIGRSIGIQQ